MAAITSESHVSASAPHLCTHQLGWAIDHNAGEVPPRYAWKRYFLWLGTIGFGGSIALMFISHKCRTAGGLNPHAEL